MACVAMEPTKEPDEQSEDEVCLLSICSLRHAQLDIDCMEPSAPPSVRANQVCQVTSSNTSNVALHSVKELPPPSRDWIIDSGCTSHMTHDRSAFNTYRSLSSASTLDLGADSSASIVDSGDVRLFLRQKNGTTSSCLIKSVLHVPKLLYQLLSVSSTVKTGFQICFNPQGVSLLRLSDASVVATGTLRNGLYTLDIDVTTTTSKSSLSPVSLVSSLNTWHERLGHVSAGGIQNMVRHGVVKGITLFTNESTDGCVGCILGKSHRAPIPKTR